MILMWKARVVEEEEEEQEDQENQGAEEEEKSVDDIDVEGKSGRRSKRLTPPSTPPQTAVTDELNAETTSPGKADVAPQELATANTKDSVSQLLPEILKKK
eukprot:998340_1